MPNQPKKFRKPPILDLIVYVIMAVGVFLLLGVHSDSELLKHSKQTPEEITAAKLAADKTCSNWHVKITDYTVEKVTIVTKSSSIEYAECTLLPKGSTTITTTIRVRNFMVNNEAEADQFAHQASIDGFFVPQTTIDPSYFRGAMRLLPNSNIVDIKVARYPKPENSEGELRWGTIMIISGLAWILFWIRMNRSSN